VIPAEVHKQLSVGSTLFGGAGPKVLAAANFAAELNPGAFVALYPFVAHETHSNQIALVVPEMWMRGLRENVVRRGSLSRASV
jgi:hypothetical protein